jgi:hypothetical protein
MCMVHGVHGLRLAPPRADSRGTRGHSEPQNINHQSSSRARSWAWGKVYAVKLYTAYTPPGVPSCSNEPPAVAGAGAGSSLPPPPSPPAPLATASVARPPSTAEPHAALYLCVLRGPYGRPATFWRVFDQWPKAGQEALAEWPWPEPPGWSDSRIRSGT